MLIDRFPAVAELLLDARCDITAFADFPQAHWRKVWSNNPISVNRLSGDTFTLAA
jgi:putative transposase